MRYRRIAVLSLGLVFCLEGMTMAAPKVLIQWDFSAASDAEAWGKKNHVEDLRVEDSALQGRIMDWDPWVTSPVFEIPASPWQMVELRMKTDAGGSGDIFYTNTTDTPYGGFSPGKQTHFTIHGDNEWHEYQIMPFWQAEDKIIMLRLDLAQVAEQDKGLKTFAVDWIRVNELVPPKEGPQQTSWDFSRGAQGWSLNGEEAAVPGTGEKVVEMTAVKDTWLSSPPMRVAVDDVGYWLSVEMAVDAGTRGTVSWAATKHNGLASQSFDLRPDGNFHMYNVDMTSSSAWDGDLMLLKLSPSDTPDAKARIRQIILSDDPQGPAEIQVVYAGLADAINRVGRPAGFIVKVANSGGQTASGLRIARLMLPAGVGLPVEPGWQTLPDVAPQETVSQAIALQTSEAAAGPFSLTVEGMGNVRAEYEGTLSIEKSLNLPRAEYVPEPHPLQSDYEIGALYFPGWPDIGRWARIWPTAPERKPVLGWYDEANPECVDWQIKWAVENGLSYFLVDWYWSAGGQHLDHWVKAFSKARYRKYLKWAMMWANHNRPGSHSEEDQREVTQWWIDNYFCMPEYYRINDMPVVMIWSPRNMERDLKDKGGVKRCLEISREMACAAGYKGIWFIAMKWPEASTEAKDIQWLADAGFNMTSLYHYMHHGGKAENPRYFPFDLVMESSYPFWKARLETDILPFLPNLSTGWDSRPWHGARATVVHSRSVPKFRRICEDARRFADETGIKRLVMAPLNEWGEGSYAEPNKEFGFGMYETVRDVFCKKPSTGWPLNYGPADVGLGPYDLPLPETNERTDWDFTEGTEGWSAMMGISDFAARDGELVMKTVSNDPAITAELSKLRAKKFAEVEVRLRLHESGGNPGSLQLFWSTTTAPITEATSFSVPLIDDREYHTYVIPVAQNRRWRGLLTRFRLDTGSVKGLTMEIDRIRLVERQ